MLTPLMFPNLTYGVILSSRFCGNVTPLVNWLAFGKLPENPVVTPSTSTQVVRPSAENRFLETVTVEPIPTTPGTGG
jgi:hypothetical protein